MVGKGSPDGCVSSVAVLHVCWGLLGEVANFSGRMRYGFNEARPRVMALASIGGSVTARGVALQHPQLVAPVAMDGHAMRMAGATSFRLLQVFVRGACLLQAN